MGDFKDHYLQPMLHFTLLHYLQDLDQNCMSGFEDFFLSHENPLLLRCFLFFLFEVKTLNLSHINTVTLSPCLSLPHVTSAGSSSIFSKYLVTQRLVSTV